MAKWHQNPARIRRRIDARPQNAQGAPEGVRGSHYGMGGNLIGGYMPQRDGSLRGFGTKDSASAASATPRLDAGPQTPGLDRNPVQPPVVATKTVAAAPGSDRLQKRLSLFSRMQAAGSGGLDPSMRQEAAGLGVTDSGYAAATAKLTPFAAPGPTQPTAPSRGALLVKQPAPATPPPATTPPALPPAPTGPVVTASTPSVTPATPVTAPPQPKKPLTVGGVAVQTQNYGSGALGNNNPYKKTAVATR